ncbi:MAG: hypothetical protein KF833_08410 [Verrucomicrobiae bacterium]|nr:hypothetical protein [Verrucomicrobiae bacterium]
MQAFQRYAVTVVFSLTCFAVPVVQGAAPEARGNAGAAKVVAPPVGQGQLPGAVVGSPGGQSGQGVSGNLPAAVGAAEGESEKAVEAGLPAKQDWLAGLTLAEQVRELTEQFKREQRELLLQYQDLMKQARDGRSEERDRIRESIKLEFDQFRKALLERQKELRDDLRQRFEEFRMRHPEHRELIEGARERARERVRERRGGGD